MAFVNRPSSQRAMALAVALSLTTAASAFAEEAPPKASSEAEPSVNDKETARNLMDLGRASYDAGKYDAALEKFQGADDIMKVPYTRLWVGKALLKLGRLVEARDRLLSAARMPKIDGEASAMEEARYEARELGLPLADRIPELALTLSGLPEDVTATVTVDGEVVPPSTLSLPRKVDPGTHTVEAKAPGYKAEPVTITVGEGENKPVALTFVPDEGRPGLPDGGEPGDSGGVALTPLFWAGVGIAGAGVIVGSITGGLSLSKASSAKEGCNEVTMQCPPENEDDANLSTTLAHVSTASFAIAGAGAILGIVGLFVGGDSSDGGDEQAQTTTAITVEPIIGPTMFGVRGTF